MFVIDYLCMCTRGYRAIVLIYFLHLLCLLPLPFLLLLLPLLLHHPPYTGMERSAREEATAKNELKELLGEIHSERERLAVAMEQCTRRIDEAARAQDDSKSAEQRERSARVESERQWEEERGDLVEHLRVARDESAQMGRARETKDGELKRVNVALETRERDLAAARDDLRVAQKELANKEQELDEHYTVDMANAETRHRTEVTTKDHRVRELEAALAERDGDTTRWEHKYVQLNEQTERIRTEQVCLLNISVYIQ